MSIARTGYSSSELMVPKELDDQPEHYGYPFPSAYSCVKEEVGFAEVSEWISSGRDELVAEAADCGVVLFQGLPLRTPDDFHSFVELFDLPAFTYEDSLSNAVRVNYTPRVFSANEAPSEVTINLHHEMAQTPIYPSKLFFFCQEAPDSGGATPVCRSDVLWDRLVDENPGFANRCEEKGLKYSHVMPPFEDFRSGMGRSWKSTFSVQTKDELESRMSELRYSLEWMEGECARATTPALPAVRTLAGGRKVFFNQLVAAFTAWDDSRNESAKALTFGDGSPMDLEGARLAAELAEELTFDLSWQPGDVALIDNFVAMHGRRTFVGKRKVLASLVS